MRFIQNYASSSKAEPRCRCGAPAVFVYSAPDRSGASAYCTGHFLALRSLPAGSICRRVGRPPI